MGTGGGGGAPRQGSGAGVVGGVATLVGGATVVDVGPVLATSLVTTLAWSGGASESEHDTRTIEPTATQPRATLTDTDRTAPWRFLIAAQGATTRSPPGVARTRRSPAPVRDSSCMHLDEFQALMASLYGEADTERGIPSTVAWLCEEVGELAQAVRKGTPAEQLHELGDVLAWVASLANQLGLSLTDAADRYVTDPPT